MDTLHISGFSAEIMDIHNLFFGPGLSVMSCYVPNPNHTFQCRVHVHKWRSRYFAALPDYVQQHCVLAVIADGTEGLVT